MQGANMLYDIVKYSKPGVYILVEDGSRVVYINYSNNILESIIRANSDICLSPNMDVIIVSESNSIVTQRLVVSQYMGYYKALGYTILNSPKVYSWKAKIGILKDKVVVYLENGSRDRYIVAVFKYMHKADQFVKQYYDVKDINTIVVGKNMRTRLEYKNREYKNDFNYF